MKKLRYHSAASKDPVGDCYIFCQLGILPKIYQSLVNSLMLHKKGDVLRYKKENVVIPCSYAFPVLKEYLDIPRKYPSLTAPNLFNFLSLPKRQQ